jgi:hypothetical protein
MVRVRGYETSAEKKGAANFRMEGAAKTKWWPTTFGDEAVKAAEKEKVSRERSAVLPRAAATGVGGKSFSTRGVGTTEEDIGSKQAVAGKEGRLGGLFLSADRESERKE